MIALIRAIASLPRRWTCDYPGCDDRFHSVQHKAMHVYANHAGDPAPTKGHTR